MNSDVYDLISLKVGMMVVTTDLYIFTLVSTVDLHSRSQGHKKQKTCASYYAKV